MLDWNGLQLDRLYSTTIGFGIAATLAIDSAEIDVTVVDATQTLDNGANGVEIGVIGPAYCIRMTELATNGLTPALLRDATIEINEITWTIEATQPRPSVLGKGSGELLLIMKDSSR